MSTRNQVRILRSLEDKPMDDPRRLKPHGNDDRSVPPAAGFAAAWLAECGMVALVAVEESTNAGEDKAYSQPAVKQTQENADPTPDREPEEALRIRLSTQKLWSEGRANPVWFECRSWIGDWRTDDRVSWRTTNGLWLAQLQRSPNSRHVFLRLWHNQTFVGHQDDTGWHPRRSKSPVAATPPGPTIAAASAGRIARMASSSSRNGSHDQSSPAPRFVHTDVISAFMWNQMSTRLSTDVSHKRSAMTPSRLAIG
jgi:hypothetical protein